LFRHHIVADGISLSWQSRKSDFAQIPGNSPIQGIFCSAALAEQRIMAKLYAQFIGA
jgi:hypothetical protein